MATTPDSEESSTSNYQETIQVNIVNEDFDYCEAPIRDETFKAKFLPVDQWREGLKMFGQSKEPPVILVDMDNTLTDWDDNFITLMKTHHSDVPITPQEKRTNFKIEMNYDDIHRPSIVELNSLMNFWLAMKPMPGAIEAIKEMASLGLVVFIVTTPDEKHTARSASEKISWIENHLGAAWKYRALLTHDKTLVKGDILIDDKPGASVGVLQPSWSHLLFSQPYNKDLKCPRLAYWSEWGAAIYSLLIQREIRSQYASSQSAVPSQHIWSNTVRHQSHRHILCPAIVFAASPRSVRSNDTKDSLCCERNFHTTPTRQSINFGADKQKALPSDDQKKGLSIN